MQQRDVQFEEKLNVLLCHDTTTNHTFLVLSWLELIKFSVCVFLLLSVFFFFTIFLPLQLEKFDLFKFDCTVI